MATCALYRAALPCKLAQKRGQQRFQHLQRRGVRRKAAQSSAAYCKDVREKQSPEAAIPAYQAVNQQTCSFLQTLSISNFALVAKETVTFQSGLNVISGASGSGKSVLLQALGVVLGMPVDKDMIRDKEDMAGVLPSCLASFLAFQRQCHDRSCRFRAEGRGNC
jgi:ABC-type glutathione transport system ATPase component